jgi:two-component system response regulator AtoC
MKKPMFSISGEALSALSGNSWKGNVRELENCIERAVILADGPEILPEHLGMALRPVTSRQDGADGAVTEGLQQTAERAARAAEVRAITAALSACQGNKTKAAEALGVSYKTLLTKIKDYGIM